jgi:hypothetical protein
MSDRAKYILYNKGSWRGAALEEYAKAGDEKTPAMQSVSSTKIHWVSFS